MMLWMGSLSQREGGGREGGRKGPREQNKCTAMVKIESGGIPVFTVPFFPFPEGLKLHNFIFSKSNINKEKYL